MEGKKIYLYGDTPMRSLLTRWRQQLNENSKLLANVEVFPEMNHNELVGWESGDEGCVAVILGRPTTIHAPSCAWTSPRRCSKTKAQM